MNYYSYVLFYSTFEVGFVMGLNTIVKALCHKEVIFMAEKNVVEMIAAILLIIGGINWGLYAFDLNLVSLIFGPIAILEKAVYVLVAISAIFVAYTYFSK